MSETSPEELLARAKNGDLDALESLLIRCAPSVRSSILINPKWQSVLSADDVISETWMEAFQDFDSFQGTSPAAFGGWLMRIAERNLRDAIRGLEREKRGRPERRVGAPADQDPWEWLWGLVTGTVTSPSTRYARKELQLRIERELNRLPDHWAMVVRLYFLEEKSVAEIADQLGRSRGAVHLLRIRALECLRERVGSG